MPRLARITVYPIKALDGVDLDASQVLAGGALARDRQFALCDGGGNFWNAKRTARIHRLRAEYDLAAWTVKLTCFNGEGDGGEGEGETGPGKAQALTPAPATNLTGSYEGGATFHLDRDRNGLAAWVGDFLGVKLTLIENAQTGLPDDPDSPGPTLISTESLAKVASWYPGMTLEETRRRFRANLEIDGVEPFWEDGLVAGDGPGSPFRFGDAVYVATSCCQRCVTPTRSPDTGEVTADFSKIFNRRREETFPAAAPRARFDHFYRLSVNMRLVSGGPGLSIRVGDELQ